MSQELSLKGYILKSQDLGEADVLLTFFSVEQGKVRVIVKSAKKMTSRLSGRLQQTGLIEIVLAGNSSLPKLIGANLVSNYQELVESQDRIAALMVMQEFANRALPDAQPNLVLFELYAKSLQKLREADNEQCVAILSAFYIEALSAVGFVPRSAVENVSTDNIYFSNHDGRFTAQSSSVDDLKISRPVYDYYQALKNSTALPEVNLGDKTSLLLLLNNFASYQLERPLRSASYFLHQNA